MQVWWWTCRPGLAARVAHGFERAFNMWQAIARRLMLMVFGSIIEPEACQLIVKNHSPLFEQDLVSMLQKKLPRSPRSVGAAEQGGGQVTGGGCGLTFDRPVGDSTTVCRCYVPEP